MKKVFKFLVIVAFGITTAACSKESGDEAVKYEDDFKFYFNATIDGVPIEINAGAAGYVLNTGYSYEDSICSMHGTLSQEGDTLRNAVTIKFRGGKKIWHPSQFVLDEMLGEGSYAYRDPSGMKVDPNQLDLRFIPDTNGSGIYHTWNLPSGTLYLDSPTVRLNRVNNLINVHLNSYISSNCQSSVSHEVLMEEECDATINVYQNPDNSLDLEIDNRSGEVSETDWYVNDNWVGRGAEHNQAPMGDGVFYVKALMTFKNGCVKKVIKEYKMQAGILTECQVDFDIHRIPVRVADADQLRTVEVIYFDAYGKRYTSYYQGNSGEFSIHSLKPYIENEDGYKTSRFLFEGSVQLKSADGSVVTVTDAFGNFVVAHP